MAAQSSNAKNVAKGEKPPKNAELTKSMSGGGGRSVSFYGGGKVGGCFGEVGNGVALGCFGGVGVFFVFQGVIKSFVVFSLGSAR